MATIGLRDTLRVTALPSGEPLQLKLSGSAQHRIGVPTDGSNLVVRALETLRRESGVAQGALVELTKRIPNQAGLGGGSSDAAAALVAGARVWELAWPLERLMEIGARLGSDIPFFVAAIGDRHRRAALVSGRGEQVATTPWVAGLPVVVVKPPEGLSTAAVYGQCRPEDYANAADADRTANAAAALAEGNWRRLAGEMRNGLQAAALRLAPWLARIRWALERCGCAGHQLSGSGSAYFGLFPTMSEARRVAARLRALRIGQTLATTIG